MHSCSQINRMMYQLGVKDDYEFQSVLLQKFTQYMSKRLRDYQAKLDELKLPIEALRKDTEKFGHVVAEVTVFFSKII